MTGFFNLTLLFLVGFFFSFGKNKLRTSCSTDQQKDGNQTIPPDPRCRAIARPMGLCWEGGAAWLGGWFLAKCRRGSGDPGGRESESRPVSHPGRVTWSLSLAKHLQPVPFGGSCAWVGATSSGLTHTLGSFHRLFSHLNCISPLMSAPPYGLRFN